VTPKVLILKASPRLKGNSAVLADQVSEGARQSGAEVTTFVLQNMAIQPCNACEACHQVEEGKCIIEDDMQQIYPALREADAVVVASPIYWFTITAQAKLCIDRWYALETSQGNVLKGKRFGVVLTYGDSDPYSSGAVNAIHTFESMERYVGFKIAGMVYGTASNVGDVEKQPALMEKAFKLGQKLAQG
jgi:multimeric flavodoxin WrbA